MLELNARAKPFRSNSDSTPPMSSEMRQFLESCIIMLDSPESSDGNIIILDSSDGCDTVSDFERDDRTMHECISLLVNWAGSKGTASPLSSLDTLDELDFSMEFSKLRESVILPELPKAQEPVSLSALLLGLGDFQTIWSGKHPLAKSKSCPAEPSDVPKANCPTPETDKLKSMFSPGFRKCESYEEGKNDFYDHVRRARNAMANADKRFVKSGVKSTLSTQVFKILGLQETSKARPTPDVQMPDPEIVDFYSQLRKIRVS